MNSIKPAGDWQQRSQKWVPADEVEAHQILSLLFKKAKESPPPISVWAKVNHGLFNNNPIQLITTWSMKPYGDKQWREFISACMEIAKLRVRAYWGLLAKFVRGRKRTFFTCSQVKLRWSQNNFVTPVGFTLTLDKIHGTRGEFTVKLTSEKK